jgi:hypothetical protein
MIFVRPEKHFGNRSQEANGNFSSRLYDLFKTLSSDFPKVLRASPFETWSDDDIRLIILILRFSELERD